MTWAGGAAQPKGNPALFDPPATTVLSPYLKMGCLSVRHALVGLGGPVYGGAVTTGQGWPLQAGSGACEVHGTPAASCTFACFLYSIRQSSNCRPVVNRRSACFIPS